MEMDHKRITYQNIDEILGGWENRYLSCGYKSVYHSIHDIYLYPNLKTMIAGAQVTYPENWSRKNDHQRLVPHLSTLDALLIALYVNILYISHIYQLDVNQRNRIWIKGIEIKAGKEPCNELENIPVFSRFCHTKTSEYSLYGHISKFSNHVGALQVDLEIDHETGGSNMNDQYYGSLKEAWPTLEQTYYGGLFKNAVHQLTNVVIDLKEQTIQSDIRIDNTRAYAGLETFQGMDSIYSVIDIFVCSSQQMQALLYQLDGVRRKTSNNLWMRKIVYQSNLPVYHTRSCRQTVKLKNTRVLTINQRRWRMADFECQPASTSNPFYLKTNLAHQLPN